MLTLDYKIESGKIINWIRQTVNIAGFKKVVIGLSGGVDSSVIATLAARALGVENVYAVLLPYGKYHLHALEDAKLLIDHLQIPKGNVFIFDITNSVNTIIGNTIAGLQVHKGNIMARVRMIYLFDLAKKTQALVCGTENKSEHLLGYFTRFGDEASDIEPIRSFYKTQVWDLAMYLGIPEKIITKAPTAGLWENQTDEGEFGFSYKDADKVLYYHFEEKLSEKEIVKKGIAEKVVQKVLKRVKENEFKHNLPYVYKISKVIDDRA